MQQLLRNFMMRLQKWLTIWVLKCLSHVQERLTIAWMKIGKINTLWLVMKKKFRVTFFYEVLDVMISEFERRFNQESRQFLTLLGDLQKRKMVEDSVLSTVGAHFSLDPVALKNEWALMINDKAIDATKPYKILRQLVC